MASAAQVKIDPDEEAIIPGEDEEVEAVETERNFEAEAREHGWAPKDEFKGDAARWVDAETFVKRADEVMPLLKAQHAKLKREFADFKRDARRMSAQIDGAEKRAFDRAKSELETRIEAAIESGDLEDGKAALKEIGELKPATSDDAGHKHTKEEAFEAFDAFREEHSWFDRGNLGGATEIEINARAMMDRIVDKGMRGIKVGEEPPPGEFFAACADEVLAKYPQLKAKAARQKPQSAVEGGGRGPAKKGNTFDDLPDGAKRMCDRFIARGIIKTREDYVKTYDWSKS